MATKIEIVKINPYADGNEDGRRRGERGMRQGVDKLLKGRYLKDTLGSISRKALEKYVINRMETAPDYSRYPELEDIYPERIEYIRGFAEGADCSILESALFDYLKYRTEIDYWYNKYQLSRQPGHCSGVLFNGPDGVIAGQSAESGPHVKKPKNYRFRKPRPYSGMKTLPARIPDKLILRKPKTGYIESWGTTNERGVGGLSGNSCGVWLDEPIEDTWPIIGFPLLRFAKNIEHLAELYKRYTLYIWGRTSQIWADVSGDAVVVEKSFRKIGIRKLKGKTIWSTEGHWETPEMNSFIRAKRLEYIEKMGKHAGADDMQYANDCAVRFAHIGELCNEKWGNGYEHIRRVLTNHDLFPRAVCRHGGPDTDNYDKSVTMGSGFSDITHNRTLHRGWIAWKKFPCETPETVTQYPRIP